MTRIYTGASMSLDGYISGPEESGFDLLFDWYRNGDVVVETAREDLTMTLTPPSAEYFRHVMDSAGALVVGRRLFDITNGWEGGGTMARQALEAGLIDEIWIDLVPVLLGGGTPMFDQVKTGPLSLDGPVSVVEGKAVTHLRYRVRR
jgi:dihydrofolate reductase